MPLYEYLCEACGARFELIRKFSDPPLEVCPTCGAGPVQKLVSSPAFQFKGSGWYITDYARKSGGGDSKSESKSENKSPSGGSGADASTPATETSSSSSGSSGSKDTGEAKPAAGSTPSSSPTKGTQRD